MLDLTNQLYEITQPISPEARSEFADVISNFAQDIPNSHIKLSAIERIRLEEERFCFETSCVTIVSRKCGHPGCQYTTVFVPSGYRWHNAGSSKWGTFIHFPRRTEGDTVIVVNDHFIASYYQGL
jgi:hypothetical protein